MASSMNPSPVFPEPLHLTPGTHGVQSISWTSAFKAEYNERTMPTPRNLTKELNVASPWIRSLDVSMSEKYLSSFRVGATPSRPSSKVFGTVPQLVMQSPGGDVLMRTATQSVSSTPIFSPPRQRMRYN
jgi:hypothetical protein